MHFREADIKCGVDAKRRVAACANAIIEGYGKTAGEICVVSCSDEYLLGINIEHLGHDYYTDIITFDYSEGEVVSGDLLISFDRVRENAKDAGVSFQEELMRVIIHGCLHLVGFGDKTNAEAKQMREEENKALNMFHVEQ